MADRRHKPDESVVREQLRHEQRVMSDDEAGGRPSEAAPEDGTSQADPTEPAGTRPDRLGTGEPSAEAEDRQDPANEAERVADDARPNGEDDSGGGEDDGTETTGEPEDEPSASDEAEDRLSALRRERDEYLAVAQRAQADFENYRKRAAKESASAGDRARSNLVRELLPAIDNLERALSSQADSEPSAEAEDRQGLADGVRLVHSELLAVLQRAGVEAFDPAGEPFDPELHEALSTRPQEGSDPGVVLDVVEKGYRLNGSVLRPARVVVSG
ncbi:MAG: nucleotide exchange factor GrpE [Thermoleophilaceae bacterium]